MLYLHKHMEIKSVSIPDNMLLTGTHSSFLPPTLFVYISKTSSNCVLLWQKKITVYFSIFTELFMKLDDIILHVFTLRREDSTSNTPKVSTCLRCTRSASLLSYFVLVFNSRRSLAPRFQCRFLESLSRPRNFNGLKPLWESLARDIHRCKGINIADGERKREGEKRRREVRTRVRESATFIRNR